MNNRGFFRHRLCKWIFAVASALVLFISGVMPANEESTLHQAVSRVAGMTTVHAEDNIASGTWGTCPWVIDANGVLTIGAGLGTEAPLNNFDTKISPWDAYSEKITSVVLNKGVIFPEDSSWLFDGFNHVKTFVGLTNVDTSKVTNMGGCFLHVRLCPLLIFLDLIPVT